MKTAIVYDWIDSWGGAERLLLTLHEMFPDADWFTSYIHPQASWARSMKFKPSFMQKLPAFVRNNRILSIPFYPFAFESFNLTSYDTVISVSSSYAKAVITRPETKHICYILSPTRFLWGSHVSSYINGISRPVLSPYLRYLKKWDIIAAQRPDICLTLSNAVKKRVKLHYNRDADVLYPPFDIEYWQNISHNLPANASEPSKKNEKEYYLLVSRLEPYKKVNVAIHACNHLGVPLTIVGTGSQEKELRSQARGNITFKKNLTDMELAHLYSQASGIIMPQEEDFGYTSLEAQFFGCPVIAYGKGGAAETVIEGQTGIFFHEQTSQSLQAALAKFEKVSYTLERSTKKTGAQHVEKFSKRHFINQFDTYI